jgi:hypothetical protein
MRGKRRGKFIGKGESRGAIGEMNGKREMSSMGTGKYGGRGMNGKGVR